MAIFQVGVANQSELSTSPYTQTLDFAGEGRKTQRESRKTAYLKTVHVVCTNSDVCIAEVYVHSDQKSRRECCKQPTTIYRK